MFVCVRERESERERGMSREREHSLNSRTSLLVLKG
jgi:hypothetical protein